MVNRGSWRLRAVWASLILAGCASKAKPLFDSKRFARQQDAGSVHVAVLAVVPWNEVVESMQPKFVLSGGDAVKEVIVASAFLEDRRLEASAFRARLGTPTTTKEVVDTATTTTEIDAVSAGLTRTMRASGLRSSHPPRTRR